MNEVVERFRALHTSGCFLLPNPWDLGSAKILERLGAKALATTSAGLAFTRGLPDEVWALPRDLVLEHARDMARATRIPVNVDFQAGYARDVEGVGENVARCAETGAAGLSIEDATGDAAAPLYPKDEALARLRAARAALDRIGSRVVLTARCEAWLVGVERPFEVARERLVAYAGAGADCLFAPGVRDPREIEALVKAVAPKPLNVIASSKIEGLSVPRLAELGVRRVSVGSALARVAWGAFLRASERLLATGELDVFEGAASFAELNELFRPAS